MEKTSVDNQIATAVTEAVTNVAPEKSDDEKLDAKAELFVRRLTDAVTKSVAALLNPDDDDDDDDEPPIRRKRSAPKPPPTPKKKSFLDSLFE